MGCVALASPVGNPTLVATSFCRSIPGRHGDLFRRSACSIRSLDPHGLGRYLLLGLVAGVIGAAHGHERPDLHIVVQVIWHESRASSSNWRMSRIIISAPVTSSGSPSGNSTRAGGASGVASAGVHDIRPRVLLRVLVFANPEDVAEWTPRGCPSNWDIGKKADRARPYPFVVMRRKRILHRKSSHRILRPAVFVSCGRP
jgi:hypothetical protein